MITKNWGIIRRGESKKPLLKLSFFCKNPLLFNKESSVVFGNLAQLIKNQFVNS